MLNIALFGPPGAGKGTQSKRLIDEYKLAYIATGDMLREEIAEGTELGKKVKGIIEIGGLADDEMIVQIIERKIKMNPEVNGYLFDGFPRTYVQAYILEGLLLKLNTSLSCMLSLEVPKDMLKERMLERAKVSGRKDDNLEVIERRLQEYDNKTVPVIDFYREKNIYYPIDGVGSFNEVYGRITNAIEHTLKKKWLNVVLFGYPGAGKGTQAKLIAEKYNLVYVSTGKILRQEIKDDTEIGRKAKPYMDKGAIVPDEIAIRLIEHKIKTNPEANGFIFKGFPRTIVQAYILDGLIRKMNSSVSCMIDLDVSPLESVKRLSARNKTDKRRPYDSDTEVIVQRLEEHEERTIRVKEYYKKQDKVITVDGIGETDTVFDRLSNSIELALRNIR